jgi:hypothetical protein
MAGISIPTRGDLLLDFATLPNGVGKTRSGKPFSAALDVGAAARLAASASAQHIATAASAVAAMEPNSGGGGGILNVYGSGGQPQEAAIVGH